MREEEQRRWEEHRARLLQESPEARRRQQVIDRYKERGRVARIPEMLHKDLEEKKNQGNT